MMSPRKSLGVMIPLGGGDPIPLKKDELIIGRQADVRHPSGLTRTSRAGTAILKFVRGTWHIRDLNSTNGTTSSTALKISSEHGLMPDNQLGIAGHLFRLDYDAAAPTSLEDANMLLKEEMGDAPRQRSLMELAGLENYDAPGRRAPAPSPSPAPAASKAPRPASAKTDDRDHDDAIDAPEVEGSEDEFFNLIKGDVEEDKPKRKR